MTTVTIHQAKTHLSKLLAQVESGEEITIARGRQAIAKLVRLDADRARPAARRQRGRLKGLIDIDDRFFEPLPEDELKLWEGGD